MTPTNRETSEDVARFNEGISLMKAGRLDEAIEKFRLAASSGKDRPMEHYVLAVALYKDRRFDAAREEFERFLSMNPQDAKFVQQAKAALAAIGHQTSGPQTPESRAGATKSGGATETSPAGARAPTSPAGPPAGAPNPLARCAAYKDAVEAYLRADYDAALEGFRTALAELPRNKHVLNNLGLTLLAMGRHPDAIEAFEKALAIDGAFLEARNNLGLAWTQYGRAKAREAFEKALEIDADFFDALVNLGALSYREGNVAEARRLWEKAHALNPADAQVRRNLDSLR